MIMTVEEFRQFVTTDETDQGLALRLQALERVIQGYTNNNFHKYIVNGVIEYPADIKLVAIKLLKWELEMQDKTGIASESISRHSVTYQARDASNTVNGYPAEIMGLLRPYVRPRFGQGLSV